MIDIEKEQRLVTIIRWAPPVTMLLFMGIMMFMVLQGTTQQTQSELAALREAVLEEQKALLEAQVEQVLQQADYEQQTTEQQLSESIQARIREAHAIATSIYNEYASLGEEAVTERINAALRPIRFNQGRGYFFIYKVTGETILHPILPQNEGVNKIDLQDIRGDYIVRGMGKAVKANGEAFYRWWFVKPDQKDTEFEKIGFGKYFEPYDWFIGTGEYIVDIEQDIQQRLLDRINSSRYANDGFVFVYDSKGTVLAHANREWINTNRYEASDLNGLSYVKTLFETAQNGGGYVEYESTFTPSDDVSGEKVSFVSALDGWDWQVGAGVYTQNIDKVLQMREQELLDATSAQQRRFFALGATATFILTIGSGFVGRRIGQRFDAFQSRIESDFEKLERSRNHMEHMALHDQLTGLPNRARLHREIELGVERSLKTNKQLAILFVDLDDFKKINDAYGHIIGDKLLQKLGMRLRDLVDNRGVVSRFGGDEFIIAFPELVNLNDAERRVEEVLNVFNDTFEIDGKSMSVSASVGVSMAPADGTDPDELITKADIVLYKSKAEKKGRVLFYDQAINRQVQYDFKLERELRQALQNNELYVLYQPQVDSSTHELIGVEALVRWKNEELGEVSPNIFISVAEEIGLIHDIGCFVLTHALRDAGRAQKELGIDFSLSINISPKQLLEDGFIELVNDELERSTMDAAHVNLEITENVLIHDFKTVLPILKSLRETGLGLSLDDFGTGYSSMKYLSALPLSEVKIDRAFISDLQENNQSQSLVKAVLAIADSAQLHVVAEGVETSGQAELLKEYGCRNLQGYLFDAPMAIKQLISRYLKV